MIKTFKTNIDYINFITSNKIIHGEIICSNFIPSAFFPKDIIAYFFNKKEHIDEYAIAADKLWRYGKNILTNLKEGKIQIAMEYQSLKMFVEQGIVHEATKNFESSLSTRIYVVETILKYLNQIYFLPEPTPFVFKLIPYETVIIDVDRNKTEQTIQGMVIVDKNIFRDFNNEFNRLKKSSLKIDKQKLRKTLIQAKATLKLGSRTILHI